MSGLNLQTGSNLMDPLALAERVKRGEVRAVSRLITLMENQDPAGMATLQQLEASSRRAAVIEITGYPGAGKSTLLDQLVTAYRRQGKTLSILAMDTSSLVTGGAILGVRTRMQDHTSD